MQTFTSTQQRALLIKPVLESEGNVDQVSKAKRNLSKSFYSEISLNWFFYGTIISLIFSTGSLFYFYKDWQFLVENRKIPTIVSLEQSEKMKSILSSWQETQNSYYVEKVCVNHVSSWNSSSWPLLVWEVETFLKRQNAFEALLCFTLSYCDLAHSWHTGWVMAVLHHHRTITGLPIHLYLCLKHGQKLSVWAISSNLPSLHFSNDS